MKINETTLGLETYTCKNKQEKTHAIMLTFNNAV